MPDIYVFSNQDVSTLFLGKKILAKPRLEVEFIVSLDFYWINFSLR